MKVNIFLYSLSTILGFYVLCNPPHALSEGQKTVYVEVQESKLRSEPKHWATAVSTVTYGMHLEEVGREAQWIQVKDKDGREGFIHVSAVTPRKILIRTEGAPLEIRPDESDILLAGKGFSKEIEEAYASHHTELDFSWIARVESVKVSNIELYTFLKQGKLNTSGKFQ